MEENKQKKIAEKLKAKQKQKKMVQKKVPKAKRKPLKGKAAKKTPESIARKRLTKNSQVETNNKDLMDFSSLPVADQITMPRPQNEKEAMEIIKQTLAKVKQSSNCSELSNAIRDNPLSPEVLYETVNNLCVHWLEWDKLDSIALSLVPSDVPNSDSGRPDFPVETMGDGNCLFRAVSRALFGTEEHHLELRVRTMVEAFLNLRYYSSNENLGDGLKKPTGRRRSRTIRPLDYYLASGHNGPAFQAPKTGDPHRQDHLMQLVAEEFFLSGKSGSYCSTLILFPLSTVIQRKIFLVHPNKTADGRALETNSPIRFFQNRMFHPRPVQQVPDALQRENITLLWTNVLEGVEYNHFVPLVVRDVNKVYRLLPLDPFNASRNSPKRTDKSLKTEESEPSTGRHQGQAPGQQVRMEDVGSEQEDNLTVLDTIHRKTDAQGNSHQKEILEQLKHEQENCPADEPENNKVKMASPEEDDKEIWLEDVQVVLKNTPANGRPEQMSIDPLEQNASHTDPSVQRTARSANVDIKPDLCATEDLMESCAVAESQGRSEEQRNMQMRVNQVDMSSEDQRDTREKQEDDSDVGDRRKPGAREVDSEEKWTVDQAQTADREGPSDGKTQAYPGKGIHSIANELATKINVTKENVVEINLKGEAAMMTSPSQGPSEGDASTAEKSSGRRKRQKPQHILTASAGSPGNSPAKKKAAEDEINKKYMEKLESIQKPKTLGLASSLSHADQKKVDMERRTLQLYSSNNEGKARTNPVVKFKDSEEVEKDSITVNKDSKESSSSVKPLKSVLKKDTGLSDKQMTPPQIEEPEPTGPRDTGATEDSHELMENHRNASECAADNLNYHRW